MFLHYTEEKLKELGVFHTHNEISHQPRLWKEAFANIKSQKDKIESFFEGITQKHKRIKVILTGAGTSAFVGDTVVPYLNKISDQQIFTIQSIPTTNIVSNPHHYLDEKTPTILISFARSGNSPESVAAVELGEQLVKDFYQIHITCNKEGFLAKKAFGQKDNLLLLMPEGSNDQSFAMTSSFTTMMLSVLLLFQIKKIEQMENLINWISAVGEHILVNQSENIKEISLLPITNIIYLGSGPLLGLAHEASLKMLELTDGDVFTYYESPLGLRHGPKTLINDRSLAIVFVSGNAYTQKYDLDLLKELYNEKKRTELKVTAVSNQFSEEMKENSDFYFHSHVNKQEFAGTELADDVWSAFPFILYAQILAVYKSLNMGIKPDNPVPNGSVNRVVQGVTIYPLK